MTEIPADQVIRIDPDGKYIIVFPMRLSEDELTLYQRTLDEWWNESHNPFLMADGGVQVIKLEKYDKEESDTDEKDSE